MTIPVSLELKARDFKGKVNPDWCPGCGDCPGDSARRPDCWDPGSWLSPGCWTIPARSWSQVETHDPRTPHTLTGSAGGALVWNKTNTIITINKSIVNKSKTIAIANLCQDNS